MRRSAPDNRRFVASYHRGAAAKPVFRARRREVVTLVMEAAAQGSGISTGEIDTGTPVGELYRAHGDACRHAAVPLNCVNTHIRERSAGPPGDLPEPLIGQPRLTAVAAGWRCSGCRGMRCGAGMAAVAGGMGGPAGPGGRSPETWSCSAPQTPASGTADESRAPEMTSISRTSWPPPRPAWQAQVWPTASPALAQLLRRLSR
jgi:hypothetical protein